MRSVVITPSPKTAPDVTEFKLVTWIDSAEPVMLISDGSPVTIHLPEGAKVFRADEVQVNPAGDSEPSEIAHLDIPQPPPAPPAPVVAPKPLPPTLEFVTDEPTPHAS